MIGRRREWHGLLFALPALALVAVFFAVPLAMTFWMSLHRWPLLGHVRFDGLANYAAVFDDIAFWHDLGFTVEYTVVITVVLFGLALPMALFVARPRRFVGLMRTAFFLPAVVGMPAASLLTVWLLNDESGLLSPLATEVGLARAPLAVLTGTGTTFAAIVVMIAWKMTGYTAMMLLPGLQGVSAELGDAAAIDGASRWQAFRFVTVPLMRRTLAMTLIISVTGSLLAFDQFYIISSGGPQNATMTAVYRIFNTSFVSFRLGYGAALSVVLLALLLAINAVQLRILRDASE